MRTSHKFPLFFTSFLCGSRKFSQRKIRWLISQILHSRNFPLSSSHSLFLSRLFPSFFTSFLPSFRPASLLCRSSTIVLLLSTIPLLQYPTPLFLPIYLLSALCLLPLLLLCFLLLPMMLLLLLLFLFPSSRSSFFSLSPRLHLLDDLVI